MRLAVDIQGRRLRIFPEAAGSGLVRYPGHRDVVLHVHIAWDQVVGMHAQVIEHGLEFVVQLLLGYVVIGRVAQGDLPLLIDTDTVVRVRQVFGGEPEVDGVKSDIVQRKHRCQFRLDGLFAFVHGCLGLADHLDVAHRVLESLHAKVKIVQPEGLLELGRVGFSRDGKHRHAVVVHIVAPDLVGAVGQSIGVLVVSRHQQQFGRIGSAARDHNDVALVGFGLSTVPVALDHHLGHSGATCVRIELDGPGVGQQGDVRILQRRAHTHHLRIRFSMHQAWESVTRCAADARTERPLLFIKHDPVWRVERVIARLFQVVGELLNTRFVRNRREGIGRAVWRLGGIFASRSMYLVELLGFGVVGFHLVVADWPGGRDTVMMAQFAEIFLALAVERSSVELGCAANAIVHLGLKSLAFFIVPGVRRDIAILDEDSFAIPVLQLARQPVTTLEQQDAFARWRQVTGERPATSSSPNNNHVIGCSHERFLLSLSDLESARIDRQATVYHIGRAGHVRCCI